MCVCVCVCVCVAVLRSGELLTAIVLMVVQN